MSRDLKQQKLKILNQYPGLETKGYWIDGDNSYHLISEMGDTQLRRVYREVTGSYHKSLADLFDRKLEELKAEMDGRGIKPMK